MGAVALWIWKRVQDKIKTALRDIDVDYIEAAQGLTVLQMLCDCLKPGGNYICTATFSTKNSAFNHK
jgi:hypothetical protein